MEQVFDELQAVIDRALDAGATWDEILDALDLAASAARDVATADATGCVGDSA